MDVNSVGSSALSNVNTNSKAKETNANTEANVAAENTSSTSVVDQEVKDVYERSQKTDYKPDFDKMQEIIKESEAKIESFRKLLEGVLNKQGQKSNVANSTAGENPWVGTRWENEEMVEISDEIRAKAKEEVGEGGYYSVDETAKRLLDFAAAVSGGDPSKIETLKGAVEKGFANAKEMWGGELPQISQDTYAAVMKGFDEWESAGSSSAITLLNPKE